MRDGSARVDVEREEDLVEEVARVHGFERIPARLPRGVAALAPEPREAQAERRAREALSGAGFDEVVNYSFLAPRTLEDGKARMERSDQPHRDTVKAVSGEYSKWRDRLEAAFNALGQTSSVRTRRSYMSVVSPGSDPVTGT